jgi:hypothetical protein
MAKLLATARPWWLLPPGKIHPAWWVAACGVIIWSDYLGGLEFFPLLYAVPAVLAAWYSGRGAAVALAVAVPLVRLVLLVDLPWQAGLFSGLGLTTIMRGIIVFFIALWFARLSEVERTLDQRVRVLEGKLPICSFCKSIRNESGEREHFETYISRKSEVRFSHGFCPSCGATHYAGESDLPNPI